MKAWVAVTDNDWYRFLRERPELDEVNFWQPSGSRVFKTLDPGQPFLFKLHYPENYIVGGGFFTHSTLLPSQLAWDTFGEKNGAASYEEMRRRIEKYRHSPANPREEYTIGCILLRDIFFFDRADWIPAPPDFRRPVVQGKSYDLSTPAGKQLWEQVDMRLQSSRRAAGVAEPRAVFGGLIQVRQRLGQGTFRILVTDVYRRRCAVTGERALPVLQAAHIRPVSQSGEHRIDNGLLLRSDVHTLFDRGYVTVTPDYRFLVSRRLKDDFDNGEQYFQFNEAELWVPAGPDERPNREFLEWHVDTVFRK